MCNWVCVGVHILCILSNIHNENRLYLVHVGHLEYMTQAKELGDYLIVIVNNDHQASLKKGKSFMLEKERAQIVKALKMVDKVVLSDDTDRTVCQTLLHRVLIKSNHLRG